MQNKEEILSVNSVLKEVKLYSLKLFKYKWIFHQAVKTILATRGCSYFKNIWSNHIVSTMDTVLKLEMMLH